MPPPSRLLPATRLRLLLAGLFLALALPSAALIGLTHRQLQWESLDQHRGLAETLVQRVDSRVQRWVAQEEARGFADYVFASPLGDTRGGRPLPQSPLAVFPVSSDIPGLLGWFQVDAAGHFSSPVLPAGDNASALLLDDLAERRALHGQLLDILSSNRLVERQRKRDEPAPPAAPGPRLGGDSAATAAKEAPAPPMPAESLAPAQVAFDRLNIAAESRRDTTMREGKQPDESRQRLQKTEASDFAEPPGTPGAALASRAKRIETGVLAELPAEADMADGDARPTVLRIFESELDPFEFARLDSGHFVLFRRVWREGQRSIQGSLIAPQPFIDALLGEDYAGSALAAMSTLELRWQAAPVYHSNTEAGGRPLYRARLSAPLADLELRWTVRQLPPGPAATLVNWLGAVLLVVLVAAFALLHRLGTRQLRLARQQQDFVSAVSHELKTPLTSIRMYGELLRAGWASEEKKREYYDYIHDESERLSRLIANVLQLARLEREDLQLELKPQRVDVMFDMLRSRVQAQIEAAGFDVEFDLAESIASRCVSVDADALVQILINLVDNALKFSARAARKRIEVSVAGVDGDIVFQVRDHGPGVPPAQRRRIFDLFVRGEAELTRETSGTGIGLALVRQLARAMGGDVDYRAADPGALFRLRVPRVG